MMISYESLIWSPSLVIGIFGQILFALDDLSYTMLRFRSDIEQKYPMVAAHVTYELQQLPLGAQL